MQKYEITLSVASFNKTTTITQPDDIDIHAFLDTCRSLAIADGYHENNWKDAVVEMAQKYLDEEDEEDGVDKGERLLIETLQGKHKLGHTDEDAKYVRKEQKTYTGKSNLTTHWGPLDTTDC